MGDYVELQKEDLQQIQKECIGNNRQSRKEVMK